MLGSRVQLICKCDVPLPGVYIVTRRTPKMAWATHTENAGGVRILRRGDFIRERFGDRAVLLDKKMESTDAR